MPDATPNDLFVGLIASLQMSAWMQLGKVMHPMTGKVERHLEQAKETIDLLGVLEEKTRGNLHPEESRLLTQMLYELRMNYVEEMRLAASPPESKPQGESPSTPPPDAPSTPSPDTPPTASPTAPS